MYFNVVEGYKSSLDRREGIIAQHNTRLCFVSLIPTSSPTYHSRLASIQCPHVSDLSSLQSSITI